MNSYGIFAQFYDILTANINYKKRAEHFHSLIKNYGGKQGGILLDLACGTGSLSEQLDELGYDVIAIDNSPEMLGIAMDKKFDSGRNIQYLCQDMRKLDMFGTIDVTVCALDSLNHLDSLDDIKQVFERVFLFCEPGGLFIFDINTEYKHKQVLGEHTFIYDTEEVYCVWQNSLENSRVHIDLDFFVPKSGVYRRYEESFCENAYPLEDINKLLESVGFEILMCSDGDSDRPVNDRSERAVYTVRKAG